MVSRTWCRASFPVVPDQFRELGGAGLLGVQGGDRIDGGDGDLPVLRSVRWCLIWAPWREPAKSRLLTVATLILRISARPWPLPRVPPWSGFSFQGKDLSCLRSFFWLPLTFAM